MNITEQQTLLSLGIQLSSLSVQQESKTWKCKKRDTYIQHENSVMKTHAPGLPYRMRKRAPCLIIDNGGCQPVFPNDWPSKQMCNSRAGMAVGCRDIYCQLCGETCDRVEETTKHTVLS